MSELRKAALRVAFAALVGAAGAGVVLQVSAWLASGGRGLDPWWWWLSLFASALVGGLAAAISVRRSFGGRLTRLAEALDGRVEDSDFLERLPEMGDDEVGRIARSFNRALARITTLQGDVIDRSRELADAQRALELAEQLARKQSELEARLTERALLFEVLRESTTSHDLDKVLDVLVSRIGPVLRANRLAVLLKTPEGGLAVRAAFGFEGGSVLGQSVAPPARGPGALDGGVTLVPDVSRALGAVDFWDDLPRTGSFAAVPIRFRDEDIGLLVLTRPEDDPLGDVEATYLDAVANQAAMAIHNAQLVERLAELATHDGLTGLPNRRLFASRLERSLAVAKRYRHPLSVLALDIDHFKELNDTHGHATGDAALVALAGALGAHVREADTAARVGGEEFWVLLPETDLDAAVEVAEKLRAEVGALEVEGAETQPLGRFSVSIGVAEHRDEEAPEALLARADDALYEAKRAGRDRVVSAPPSAASPAPAG